MSDYSAVAPPSTVVSNVDTSPAFADALQRARQIAAKFTPTGESTTNGTTTGQKRPLEEDNSSMDFPDYFVDASAPKKIAAMNDPYGAQLAAMQRGNATNSQTEEYKVPDKMVGLIIGRGGEQITRLQAESGCKVQMAADSGGMSERSCSLTGPRQAIDKAKEMIDMIIKRGAPLAPATGNGGMMESMVTGNAVAEVNIPAGKVGLVIGKGGETIKNLQERAGVKMVMIQEGPQITGQDKPLRISGDAQKCEYAKQLIMDLITEKEIEGRGSNFRNQYQNEYGSQSQNRNEIGVPKPAVGVVIGKGGEMIKKIQSDTGAKVQFQQGKDEGPGDRLCVVSGSPDQVHHATNIIHELINSVMQKEGMRGGSGRGGSSGGGRGNFNERRGGGGSGGGGFGGGGQEVSYPVPAAKCGVVIGKGGETIRAINSQSGAHVELDRNQQTNPYEKVFILRGTPDQIQQAQELIAEKIGVPPPAPNHAASPYAVPSQHEPAQNQVYGTPQGWGGAYQQWNQSTNPADPATAAPAGGNASQPDYSQAWVEYYRSLGMFREAEMVEQQARSNQGGQPQPAVGVTQPAQQAQYPTQAPAAGVNPPAQPAQPAQQQYTQYGQYAAAAATQPQQPQQFSGQQPAAAGYNYNYPGYTAPQ